MRGGAGILGTSSSSSSCGCCCGREGSPGIGIPRPALGLLDVSSGGGLGADRSAPMLEAPIGGAPLNRSRIELTPPAGDVGTSSCSPSSSLGPVRC